MEHAGHAIGRTPRERFLYYQITTFLITPPPDAATVKTRSYPPSIRAQS